jgi:hypothetical protein
MDAVLQLALVMAGRPSAKADQRCWRRELPIANGPGVVTAPLASVKRGRRSVHLTTVDGGAIGTS